MENSKIEWTHHTFNPWHGCLKVSAGCEHCYAEALSKRWGKDIWGPAATTSRQMMSEAYWRQPIQWNRKAKEAGERHRVFCASMADVFENHPQVIDERRRLLDLIIKTPHLDWLLLTKRPENINWMIEQATGFSDSGMWFHAAQNVWIGTSVEDQPSANKRIPELTKIPAAIRFLSIEPLLGPIDLGRAFPCGYYCDDRVGHVDHPWWTSGINPYISWMIIGGESGHGARPMQIAWAESLIKQCRAANVAVHVKQLGSIWAKENGAESSKGGDWAEWPEHLRIREYPQVFA